MWVRQALAAALSLVLLAGNAAVCAGWAATPEERMACCVEGQACPMHAGESEGSDSDRIITQAQADSCCATSEREQSSQSSPTFATAIGSDVLGEGVAIVVPVPALVLHEVTRDAASILVRPVPKHVLLSVFLI